MSTYSKLRTTNIQLYVNVVLFENNGILELCIKTKSTRNYIDDFIKNISSIRFKLN